MIEWSEQHILVRDAFRKFIETEIAANLDALEHGDMPPYDVLRKLIKTFGIDQFAKERFAKQMDSERKGQTDAANKSSGRDLDSIAMQTLLTIELSRYCPGMVTAMGVSMGLTAGAIMAKGSLEQKERFVLPLLTLEKVGSWAITEPGSGSDAFGSMKATARLTSDGKYVLNGNKTFITNGPYADTIVFICRLDDPQVELKQRPILTFVLDSGMPGLTQSKPFRKMGIHSSPTGELFLQDVVVEADRLLDNQAKNTDKSGAKATFAAERMGVPAMALGIVETCLELSIQYAKERVQFGRPIGEFQLVQLKIAKMEVARTNLQNMVFRNIELQATGKPIGLAEASAMKLYAAQTAMEVALEAVQIHGGNGYMVDYRVEQLCRDAKILQIYGGTDEIQISAIARDLLSR